MHDPRRYLRTADAATYCGLSRRTLEKLRQRSEGPPFIRLHGRKFVVYDVGDLDAWLRTGRREPSAEPAESSA